MRVKKKRMKKSLALLMTLCIGMTALTGCKDSNAIKEETSQSVQEKSSEALALYADIEKIVSDHKLQTEQSFTDMKKQLTDMSAAIKEQVKDTTEEDGQNAIVELDKIIENLKSVKESVEKTVE